MSNEVQVDSKVLEAIAAGVQLLTAGAQQGAIERAQMNGKMDGYGAAISGLLKTVNGNGEGGLRNAVTKLELRIDFLEKNSATQKSAMSDYIKMLVSMLLGMLATYLMFRLTK